MNLTEIISNLLDQANEWESMIGRGAGPECIVIRDADVMREAAEILQEYDSANRPLTLDELRTLPENEWVWIECREPIPYTNGSAYYRKIDAIRPEVMFECGYPGWGTSFRYDDYDKTWLAYRRRPEGKHPREVIK